MYFLTLVCVSVSADKCVGYCEMMIANITVYDILYITVTLYTCELALVPPWPMSSLCDTHAVFIYIVVVLTHVYFSVVC